jgi:hypothetical protein
LTLAEALEIDFLFAAQSVPLGTPRPLFLRRRTRPN